MKDILKDYLENTVEMRAMLAQRSPEEVAFDNEVLRGLKKGFSIRKALKRAGKKYPDEELEWDEETIGDISEHYERFLNHEEIMAKARALGFKEEIRVIKPAAENPDWAGSGQVPEGNNMGVSFVAMNRMLEEQMAQDTRMTNDLARKGKAVLRFGRKMTDEQLLAKLNSIGVSLEKEEFGKLRNGFLSAEEMAKELVRERGLKFNDFEEDWLWVCLTVLWERWQSASPGMEMIDDAMQEGYERLEKRDVQGAAKIWLGAWKDILSIMDGHGMRYLDDFDDKFRGTQSVSNWIGDMETELHNAGIDNPEYWQEQINFCEEVIGRLRAEDVLTVENMRRSIGEAYAQMGDMQKSDALFEGWLKDDPRWGWGWIGWSDCYSIWKGKDHNLGRAEEILKQGLAAAGVRDRPDILERLMNVYEDMGRKNDADRIHEELAGEDNKLQDGDCRETTEISVRDNVMSVKTKVRYGGMGMPLDEWGRSLRQPSQASPSAASKKVGRNELCPCGSGKKYKKCCGR